LRHCVKKHHKVHEEKHRVHRNFMANILKFK
jgi:hypothetical protein